MPDFTRCLRQNISTCTRACTPSAYENDWTLCPELLYVGRGFHDTSYGWGAYISTCGRALSFPYLGKGWTRCAEVWYLAMEQQAKHLYILRMGSICKCLIFELHLLKCVMKHCRLKNEAPETTTALVRAESGKIHNRQVQTFLMFHATMKHDHPLVR